jgi:GTP-binding protein
MRGLEKKIKLTLKLIADIGLIGRPNAGKSTLLSKLTKAQPRIDTYAFTTLVPNLGSMTYQDERVLILADIPGLIEGASAGRGLGHRFLKHIERTKLLLHLLDITYQPGAGILEDYWAVVNEMRAYSTILIQKPQMVLINKMDLYGPQYRELGKLRKALEELGVDSMPISALTGEGLDQVKEVVFEKWG